MTAGVGCGSGGVPEKKDVQADGGQEIPFLDVYEAPVCVEDQSQAYIYLNQPPEINTSGECPAVCRHFTFAFRGEIIKKTSHPFGKGSVEGYVPEIEEIYWKYCSYPYWQSNPSEKQIEITAVASDTELKPGTKAYFWISPYATYGQGEWEIYTACVYQDPPHDCFLPTAGVYQMEITGQEVVESCYSWEDEDGYCLEEYKPTAEILCTLQGKVPTEKKVIFSYNGSGNEYPNVGQIVTLVGKIGDGSFSDFFKYNP